MKQATAALVAGAVLAAGILGVAPVPAHARDSGPLNVIIIGLDTLRPDHLGCYGYPRNTSPAIDRLAGEGALFEYAVSQSPWTLPSFATVFTSLYPTQHRAGFLKSTLGTDFPTLASILSDNGYSTGAVVNTAALNPAFGIDRGFAHYDVAPMSAGRVADGTTRDALEWVDGRADRSFFLFVHYYDPHLSYSPPAPYDTLFDPDYTGPIGNSFDPDFLPTDRMNGFQRMNALPARDKEHIVALYDGEVAFADTAIGELLKGLEARGLRDRTLIVFMSDHGEEFFEHGGFAHGHTLYNELIHVPLLFSLPGRIPTGMRLRAMVRLVDIMPTVLSMLGIDTDARLEGRDLSPLFRGETAPGPTRPGALLESAALSEALLYGPEQKSISAFPYKLILHTNSGKEAMFDLDIDPGETVDVAEHDPGGLEGNRLRSARNDLGQQLYGALFRASATWYVQVDPGGAGHMLDLRVRTDGASRSGTIEICRAIDPSGRLLEDAQIGLSRESASRISLNGLSLDREFILAFTKNPMKTVVSFDFFIDGRPADDITYVGEGMSHPAGMPFEAGGAGRGLSARGKPDSHPDPPYILVWQSPLEYRVARPAALSDETLQELRSLGYIH
jgi:arylsulfatase A-like enzyme